MHTFFFFNKLSDTTRKLHAWLWYYPRQTAKLYKFPTSITLKMFQLLIIFSIVKFPGIFISYILNAIAI